MERYIIRSRQVFTGLRECPQPAAIVVADGMIERVLPRDYEGFPDCGGLPVKDYGDALIIPSFLDAHTHMFSGAVDASDYVCDTLGECGSEAACAERIVGLCQGASKPAAHSWGRVVCRRVERRTAAG